MAGRSNCVINYALPVAGEEKQLTAAGTPAAIEAQFDELDPD
jgi:hypothetical protein